MSLVSELPTAKESSEVVSVWQDQTAGKNYVLLTKPRDLCLQVREVRSAESFLHLIDAHHVQYRVKDTKNRRLTPVIYSNEEFVRLVMPHVNNRYCNSMRYFGLLAPRSKMLLAKVFSVLKQQQTQRPVRLTYAESIYRTFGHNPLIGPDGRPLLRVGHIRPLAPLKPHI